MTIGRNEPCPCGSGRKYKHCCLANLNPPVAEESAAISAQRKAHEWLRGRFSKRRMREILEDYLQVVLEQADEEFEEDSLLRNFIDQLDEAGQYVFRFGLNDWALHETEYEIRGEQARGIDRVLAASDLRLSAAQRSFLEAASSAHLHIYEVTAVEAERGLRLRDVLNPDSAPRFVHEVSASRALVAGSLIGTRVVECDDQLSLGTGIYPLTPIGVLEILFDTANLRTAEEDDGRIPAWLICDNWIRDQIDPPVLRAMPIPRLPHIEDHYAILDLDGLKVALEGHENVETINLSVTVWMYTSSDGQQTHLMQHARLETGEPDRSALLMRNTDEESADAGREWLEQLAGACLRHRVRQHIEPPDEDLFRLPLPIASDLDEKGENQQIDVREGLETRYADWCDTPLDILDARTPRAMIAEPAGRFRVMLLLRVYDEVEASLASHQGRAAVTFDFLRERLGLGNTE